MSWNAIIVLLVMAVALIVGQYYPFVGGLIATLPVKIIGYMVGAPSADMGKALMGLIIGSAGSMLCAFAALFAFVYDFKLVVIVVFALAVWSAVAGVGYWVWR